MKDACPGDLLAPSSRSGHAACARREFVVVHGGVDEEGIPIDEGACLWLWNSKTLSWTRLADTSSGNKPGPMAEHRIFYHAQHNALIVHGGIDSQLKLTTQTWQFDLGSSTWARLPNTPAPSLSAAFVDGSLYTVSGDADVGGFIHTMDLDPGTDVPQWTSVGFPSNPLSQGPRPRVGGPLIPVSTGYGRYYLIYLFGSREDAPLPLRETRSEEHPYYSDIWALQIPSKGVSGASIKDSIREAIPRVHSGSFSWAEVEIVPVEESARKGKVHPGPRGFFAADTCADGREVILWGGLNAKKETEADGWLLKLL